MTITIKTGADIDGMRIAGRLAAEVLDMLAPHVRPGATTEQLDRLAHDLDLAPHLLGHRPACRERLEHLGRNVLGVDRDALPRARNTLRAMLTALRREKPLHALPVPTLTVSPCGKTQP